MNHYLGAGGHLSAQPLGGLKDYVAVDPVTERPAVVNFPLTKDNPYRIDLPKTAELIEKHKPELIALGKSMVLHREPIEELARMASSLTPKPIVMYDAAHVLGLMGPHFQQPFREGADIMTGSTHKTFFGTQRGIISSNMSEGTELEDLWNSIVRRAFPGSVSNHHLGTLLGLLMAAYEMNAYGAEYQKQVLANARSFARALKEHGLQVEGDPAVGYTETHQVVLRVGHTKGIEVAQRLEKNNIVVNYQALPDDEAFTAASGIRMGVQEMTRFGMQEADFSELAGFLAQVILHDRDVSRAVSRFRSRFLAMHYCLPEEQAKPLVQELLGAVL
jgi:glycine/serine hydroxymethyltransferase